MFPILFTVYLTFFLVLFALYHAVLPVPTIPPRWTFLVQGKALGVPVSPFLEDLEDLVVKNKNMEGGLGIYFFQNALYGGDFILQKKIKNAAW